jgi:hypothetical protein
MGDQKSSLDLSAQVSYKWHEKIQLQLHVALPL